MAGDKNKAEQIVSDVIIQACGEIGHRHLPNGDLAAELLVLAFEQMVAAQPVDRAILGDGH